jgi:hypothetical protein
MPARPDRHGEPHESAHDFYRHALRLLEAAGVPVLVGGAYALRHYTGIARDTKDFDLFVRRDDYARVEAALGAGGVPCELTFPHWLGKASCEAGSVDVIFSSGNGVAQVDDAWFEHAVTATVLGATVRLSPPEEMIWSKAFVTERERYDGADVMHLLLACAARLDWKRLLARFDTHWRLLLSYLCLFGFVYPSERALIPRSVMSELIERLARESRSAPPRHRICQGTLLSREQYLTDIGAEGFDDARLIVNYMTLEEIAHWTRAICEGPL